MTEIKNFLSHINISKLSEDKGKLCQEDLTEKDLCNSLKSIQNDKFYETFWNELKEIFIDSVSKTKEKANLSRYQRQVIIRLIEKKIKIRDLYKTRDPFLY